FGMSRVLRYKVHTRATQPLIDKGMNFGVRYAYDMGKCTGPGKYLDHWESYGMVVGCNALGSYPFPNYTEYKLFPYPGAVWYSLPGNCGSMEWNQADADCRAEQVTPTGAGNCTYSYEAAGEISLGELDSQQGDNRDNFWREADGKSCLTCTSCLREERYPGDLKDTDLQTPPCPA
ncbi:unnamed protein product, partial [Polarella glacialis]